MWIFFRIIFAIWLIIKIYSWISKIHNTALRNILMTIFTGLIIAVLVIIINPDFFRTNPMRNYPFEDEAYSDNVTLSRFAPYTLVIDNGLDADVELLVNNKNQRIDKKSHIILRENEKELSINRNDRSYHFTVNDERQYVFNIDTINDYQVIRRTYSKYALLQKPDSIVKTVENELFFGFKADYIDFWFEIPSQIEVSHIESFKYSIYKYALTKIDY